MQKIVTYAENHDILQNFTQKINCVQIMMEMSLVNPGDYNIMPAQ